MQAVGKKGKINIRFEGGSVSGLGTTPAAYTTANEEVQKIIEGTERFKSGRITLVKSKEVEKRVEEESPEAKVKTLQQARQFLMDMGVPMEELQSKAKVLEAAKEKGITFPNL